MNMKLEILPPYFVAYLRHTGPYGSGNVQIMERLKAWAKVNHLLDDNAVILGIAQDNPETTQPQDCRYDVCLVLSDTSNISGGDVTLTHLAGGRYAVFTVDHTAEAVAQAWQVLFPALSEQGCRPDETRPILERYAMKMVNSHLCEICVPVE